eukprot:COSAG02_NODE_2478_length_8730_cov_2.636079_9_plen_76_part_00
MDNIHSLSLHVCEAAAGTYEHGTCCFLRPRGRVFPHCIETVDALRYRREYSRDLCVFVDEYQSIWHVSITEMYHR